LESFIEYIIEYSQNDFYITDDSLHLNMEKKNDLNIIEIGIGIEKDEKKNNTMATTTTTTATKNSLTFTTTTATTSTSAVEGIANNNNNNTCDNNNNNNNNNNINNISTLSSPSFIPSSSKISSKTMNQIITKLHLENQQKISHTTTHYLTNRDNNNNNNNNNNNSGYMSPTIEILTKEEIEEFTGITNGNYQKVYAPAEGMN
jgi:hypothetical protein